MKLFAITDIHGNPRYLRDVEAEVKTSDLVIIAGDITNFGSRKAAAEIIDTILSLNANIVAVAGNCDEPDVADFLREKEIDLHGKIRLKNGISFSGVGGSLPAPVYTPNTLSDEEIEDILKNAMEKNPNNPLILVTHNPPYRTKVDRVMGVRHVGSKSIRKFIEERKPLLCISGHIHESVGIDRLEDTLLVNPGAFKSGRYALIELEEDVP
ncbi:MAG: hypothetical protein DRP87_19490, partial [Spirochaetes bacterium]